MKGSVLFCIGSALLLTGCSYHHYVSVENPSDFDREGEIVEVALADLGERPSSFVVKDRKGDQVPYQITYDSLLIFPVNVSAGLKSRYKVAEGIPDKFDTLAVGSLRLDRLDDIAWENDKVAFRTYGPAFEKEGFRAYGYDAFTKSVRYPVVDERYRVQKLKMSIHQDHGNGMDVYTVGETLGCGADALMFDDAFVYPHVYETEEILDNGPLRFTVNLKFPAGTVGSDKNVVETRVLSLDAGSHLNKISVSFSGLSSPAPLAVGLAIHKENPNGYSSDSRKGILSCIDLGGSAEKKNGLIFCGAVRPEGFSLTRFKSINPDGSPSSDGALGHIIGVDEYVPGTLYTYWTGSGWNKPRPQEEGGNVGIKDEEAWTKYLERFTSRLLNPLIVKVK